MLAGVSMILNEWYVTGRDGMGRWQATWDGADGLGMGTIRSSMTGRFVAIAALRLAPSTMFGVVLLVASI